MQLIVSTFSVLDGILYNLHTSSSLLLPFHCISWQASSSCHLGKWIEHCIFSSCWFKSDLNCLHSKLQKDTQFPYMLWCLVDITTPNWGRVTDSCSVQSSIITRTVNLNFVGFIQLKPCVALTYFCQANLADRTQAKMLCAARFRSTLASGLLVWYTDSALLEPVEIWIMDFDSFQLDLGTGRLFQLRSIKTMGAG